MRVAFSDDSFVPIDRPYTRVIDKKPCTFLTLGAGSYVIDSVFEWDGSKKVPHVLIGRFCSVARDVSFFLGLNHNYKNVVSTYPFDVDFVMEKICATAKITTRGGEPEMRRFENHYQIIVGNDVWIGQGATITGGVRIGDGAIVGTNAMVTKNVPPYATVAGNPARIVNYRFDAETIKKFMAVQWWNWSIKKIYKNLPLIYEPEKFLAAHYAPIDFVANSEINSKRQAGWKIYAFVADFAAKNPLWKKIIADFTRADFENALLLILPNKKFRAKDLKALGEFTDPRIMKIPDNAAQIARQTTHFITTRETANLEILSNLYDTDVQIISALDDRIFEK